MTRLLPHWLRAWLVQQWWVKAFMRGYAEQRAKDEACDGSPTCPAGEHIEGCFNGPGWQ